ncbi:MAG: hypothetical protein J5I93_08575 [Pirellulaceae bacterium]|nr:hypothetical protein [Pirellulaceae bacterium]
MPGRWPGGYKVRAGAVVASSAGGATNSEPASVGRLLALDGVERAGGGGGDG